MADRPTFSDSPPYGATMHPNYMGRTMTTYPVSEPEMEQISILSAQVTTRFSLATLLLGLGASIWTNAIFVNEMTAEGKVASLYVAPALIAFAVLCAIGGLIARRNRASTWQRIKNESTPVQTLAEAGGLMVTGSRSTPRRGRS
jgi:hypothetical protein